MRTKTFKNLKFFLAVQCFYMAAEQGLWTQRICVKIQIVEMKYLRAVMGFTRADTLEVEDTRTELDIFHVKKKSGMLKKWKKRLKMNKSSIS
jgi:hypothetical protein